MEKFKAALPDLKMKKLVTFWPPPLGSKTIVAEDRNPITQKAKPELDWHMYKLCHQVALGHFYQVE